MRRVDRVAIAAGAPRYTVEQVLNDVVLPAYTELLAVDNLEGPLMVEAPRGLFHLWSDGFHGGVCACDLPPAPWPTSFGSPILT